MTGRRAQLTGGLLVVLALVVAGCGGGEGSRQPEAPTEIVVDVYSGRENPRVALDPETAAAITEVLAENDPAFMPTESPDDGLGFRGFVLAGADPDTELRVVPDVVYRTTSGGQVSAMADADGVVYAMLWDAVSGELPAEVLAELPEP